MQQALDGSEGLTIERALAVIRRHVLLIALCVGVVAGVAFAYSSSQPKKYTATASLSFNSNQLSEQVAGLSETNGDLAAQQASNLALVKLGDLAASTASIVGHGLTRQDVAEDVSIAGVGESGIVTVSATTRSPSLSADITNAYSRKFVEEQRSAYRQYFRSALAIVDKQLERLGPKQRLGVGGAELENRAEKLRLLSELDFGGVKVAQEAVPPTSPSSPRRSRTTAIGGLLGLVIGLGVAFMLERADRRIRSSDDLEAIYGLPLLGAIPVSSALSGPRARAELPLAEAEAFGLMRAHLRFFNVDRDVRTVLVVSPEPGDGKTTIALRLAEAAAAAGSRTLLVEADLRAPALARALNLDAAPGITDVLIGASTLHDAVSAVELNDPDNPPARTRCFDVVVAGGVLPPNPAELLEGHSMRRLLSQTSVFYDLVVVDVPPLTVVPDAVPLLREVDGVVAVGRVGHSSRDAAARLSQVLKSSGATVLGVIANGVRSGPAVYAPPAAERRPSHPTLSKPVSVNGAGMPEELAPTAGR